MDKELCTRQPSLPHSSPQYYSQYSINSAINTIIIISLFNSKAEIGDITAY